MMKHDLLRRMTGAVGDTRGQAVVEFALVAPLVLLLLLGIVEFGRAWNAYQVVTDAAREGARIAAVATSPDTVSADTVKKRVVQALERAGLRDCTITCVDVTSSPNGWPAGALPPRNDTLRVNVTYPFQFTFLKPFMQWTTADASIELKTSFVMRKE